MQTIQWGPEGWVLFHVLPYYYAVKNPSPNRRQLFKEFYTVLKDVLPCIYCRNSYKDFLAQVPIDGYLDGSQSLLQWTYLIHNLVNKKLRDQGYLDEPDPSFAEVLNRYNKLCKAPNDEVGRWHMDSKGWLSPSLNFIATIVFNYDPKDADKVAGYAKLFDLWPRLQVGPEMRALRQIIKRYPPRLESQQSLIEWYFEVIQRLIRQLGCDPENEDSLKSDLGIDPSFSSYDKYIEKFESRRAKCKQKSCRILKK
jgi:hypothetical protein